MPNREGPDAVASGGTKHRHRPDTMRPGLQVYRLMFIGLGAFLAVMVLFPVVIWWLGTRKSEVALRPASEPAVASVAPGLAGPEPGVAEAVEPQAGKPEWLAHDSPESVFERLWPLHMSGEATAEELDALIFLAQELRYLGRARAVLDARMARTDPEPGVETKVLQVRQAFLENHPERGDQLFLELVREHPDAWADGNLKWLAGQVVERWVRDGQWQGVIDLLEPVRVPLPPVFHRHLALAWAASGDNAAVARLVATQPGSFTPLERVRARFVLAALEGKSAQVARELEAGLNLLREGAAAGDWAGWFETVGTAPEHLPVVVDALGRTVDVYASEAEKMALIARAGRAGTWAAHRAVAGMFESMHPADPVFQHNRLYLDLVAGKTGGRLAVAEAKQVAAAQVRPEFYATVLLALLRANLTGEVESVLALLREQPGLETAGYRWIVAWGEAARGRPERARELLNGIESVPMLAEERAMVERLQRNLAP